MAGDGEERADRAPLRVYALTALLLVATVPMLPAHISVLGLPLWAVGSLFATAVYAVAVATALGRHFDDGVRDAAPPADDRGDDSP